MNGFVNPRRVEKYRLTFRPRHNTLHDMPGRLRLVRNDRHFFFNKTIEESGLSGIRTSDDGSKAGLHRSVSLTGHSLGDQRLQAEALHAPAVRVEDFDFDTTVFDLLAGRRQPAKKLDDGAPNRGAFGFGDQGHAEFFFDDAKFQATRDDEYAFAFLHHLFDVGFRLVMDLADNLFDKIFHGDQAGDAAVFIDHENHVIARLLHLLQQVVYGLGLRNKGNRLDHQANALGPFALLPDPKKVALVNEAFDVVQIVAIHGNTRMTLVDDQLEQLVR